MAAADKPIADRCRHRSSNAVIARLARCDAGLILNANASRSRRSNCLSSPDSARFSGPLAGILAALDWAAVNRPDVDYMLSAAADCPVPAARSRRAPRSPRADQKRRACGRGFRRTIAPGDRAMERGVARTTSHALVVEDVARSTAGTGRYRCHRDLATESARSLFNATPWTTSPRPSGWPRWMRADSSLAEDFDHDHQSRI